MKLSRAALALRAAHAAVAAEQLIAIAYVWWCALSGRRGRLLRIAAATLGAIIAAGLALLVARVHRDVGTERG